MRIVHTLAVLAALSIPAIASADTISFGSGESVVTYNNTFGSGTAVLYTSSNPYGVGSYTTPVAGTSYITWDDSQNEMLVPAGDTTYSLALAGPSGATGSVSFAADNSVVVYLNGTEIGSSGTFTYLTSADFTLGSGSNILTLVVTNTEPQPAGSANPTALDFGGTYSFTPAPPPSVPEPSSLALLGTGVLGIAGAARRRFKA